MKRLNKNGVKYNEATISELKIAMETEKNLRTYKRYSVVLKHFQGFTNRSIATMEDLDMSILWQRILKPTESRE